MRSLNLNIIHQIVYTGYTQKEVNYIRPPTSKGLCGVVLQDKSGRRSHTVWINSELKIVYDHMETHEMKLNMQNLNNPVSAYVELFTKIL